MNKVTDIVYITVSEEGMKHTPLCYSYLEYWNPSKEQVKNIIPYLEQNRTILYIWLYGHPDLTEDWSDMFSSRVVKPFFLARTKEAAEKVYIENRHLLVGH